MRVLDASVVTDAVAVDGSAGRTARRLLAEETWLHAPAMLLAEVTSALRAMARRGDLAGGDARAAVMRAASIRSRRFAIDPFLPRVWELRENVTVYDAWYIALAESLGVALVTADDRLRGAPGVRCPVVSPTEALGS